MRRGHGVVQAGHERLAVERRKGLQHLVGVVGFGVHAGGLHALGVQARLGPRADEERAKGLALPGTGLVG